MSKFIFDGVNLKIRVNPSAVFNNSITFSINELWTEWLDWIATGDNSKYPLALRTAGGDPIGGGQYVGTFLFLRNDLGWRGVPPDVNPCKVIIEGSFFGESAELPLMENVVGQETDLIINRSSLTMAINTGGGSGGSVDLTPVMSYLTLLESKINSIPGNTWSNTTRTLTEPMVITPVTEAKIHEWLDNYDNKDDWKASAENISSKVWGHVI